MTGRKQNLDLHQLWQYHLDAWALTGLSQAEYCRQNDLKVNRFTYWKHRLHKGNSPVEFVQIHERSTDPLFVPDDRKPLRLTVASRFTIEITDNFSENTLEKLLLVLGRI